MNATEVGLGCGNFGEFLDAAESRRVVEAALDVGIARFDTADVYGDGASEEYLGRALAGQGESASVITKFGAVPGGDGAAPGSAETVRRSCEASLARLGRDSIDLYLFHHPDPLTPIGETLAAMDELRRAGKVREIGCSNFTPAQIEEAAVAADTLGIDGFRILQNGYSLLDRTPETELLPACLRHGIGLIPYMPLAGGMLTGKYRRAAAVGESGRMARELRGAPVRDYFPALLGDESFEIVDSLGRFSAAHGHTLLELAFGWLASSPQVACLVAGATTPEQVHANLAAASGWRMSEAEREAADRLTRTDVSFVWHPGTPDYAQPPAASGPAEAPHLRHNIAAERSETD